MRKSFVKNIQKVNNTFYGTLRANIMPQAGYNYLLDTGKNVTNHEQTHTHRFASTSQPNFNQVGVSQQTPASSLVPKETQ